MLEADLRLLTVVLWRVWFRPNKFVHEQVALPAEDVVTWSVSFVSDYVAAADGEKQVAVPRKMVSEWEYRSEKISSKTTPISERGMQLPTNQLTTDVTSDSK
ncbi:hypothetical protein ACOSP7_031018 [Xanthoceras sorbifolium]